MKYLFIKVEKPLSNFSKVAGKNMSIKDWCKQKHSEIKEPDYTDPVSLCQVFEEENHIKVYARNNVEFAETFKKYMEKIYEQS